MRAPERITELLTVQLCLIAFLLGTGANSTAAEDRSETILENPSAWIRTIDPKLWGGYKDNVLLANRNTVESPFAAAGLDLTMYRLPLNGWEMLFLATGEYIRYVDAPQVQEEALAIAQGQVKKEVGSGWKPGISADYLYFNQVFDASTFEDELLAIQVEAHEFTLRPSLAKQLAANLDFELELVASRQIFQEFIDNYWEIGPKLTLDYEFKKGSDLSLSYQFTDRIHDDRETRDSEGLLQPGTDLRFYQHDLSSSWRRTWDQSGHWRTTARLGLRRNEDSGGGFYNYWRPQASVQLRYRAETWEARLEGRFTHYWYDRERIGLRGSPLRRKTYVTMGFRGEKNLMDSMKVFAQYEYERAISNLTIDAYDVNTVSAGVEWVF